MGQTVHVFPANGEWVVSGIAKRDVTRFATQKEAIRKARSVARSKAPSQIAVLDRQGRVLQAMTYGLPRILNSPSKSPNAKKIAAAVGKLTLKNIASKMRA